MTPRARTRALINRLARLDSASSWSEDMNPVQRAALEYLREANRFSRSPSHVAEFLGTTRGTMSQTLKTLLRKGYIEEVRSQTDKRSISYALTQLGKVVLNDFGVIAGALEKLEDTEIDSLEHGLQQSLAQALRLHDNKSFGQCKTCHFHRKEEQGAFCTLLSLPLGSEDAEQICVEHQEVGRSA